MFENGARRNISGPKKEEVTEEWRRLPDEELYDLYRLPNTMLLIH